MDQELPYLLTFYYPLPLHYRKFSGLRSLKISTAVLSSPGTWDLPLTWPEMDFAFPMRVVVKY